MESSLSIAPKTKVMLVNTQNKDKPCGVTIMLQDKLKHQSQVLILIVTGQDNAEMIFPKTWDKTDNDL